MQLICNALVYIVSEWNKKGDIISKKNATFVW